MFDSRDWRQEPLRARPPAAFLLSLPIPTQSIFQWKFLESTVLASWAFLFLRVSIDFTTCRCNRRS